MSSPTAPGQFALVDVSMLLEHGTTGLTQTRDLTITCTACNSRLMTSAYDCKIDGIGEHELPLIFPGLFMREFKTEYYQAPAPAATATAAAADEVEPRATSFLNSCRAWAAKWWTKCSGCLGLNRRKTP